MKYVQCCSVLGEQIVLQEDEGVAVLRLMQYCCCCNCSKMQTLVAALEDGPEQISPDWMAAAWTFAFDNGFQCTVSQNDKFRLIGQILTKNGQIWTKMDKLVF